MNTIGRCFAMLVLVVVLSPIVLANGNGDVSIHVSGHPLSIPWTFWSGEYNIIEFWITNDAPVYQMTIGFAFSCSEHGAKLVTPYGSLPTNTPYLMEHGDFAGKFDIGGLQVYLSENSDTLYLTGAALNAPLPAHSTSTLAYSVKLMLPSGQGALTHFCIDNIVTQPSGVWAFDDSLLYAPDFNAVANSSPTNPDAPPMCSQILECKGFGDANFDCATDISDAVYLIEYIFSSGPAPSMNADITVDGVIDISDVVAIIDLIF